MTPFLTYKRYYHDMDDTSVHSRTFAQRASSDRSFPIAKAIYIRLNKSILRHSRSLERWWLQNTRMTIPPPPLDRHLSPGCSYLVVWQYANIDFLMKACKAVNGRWLGCSPRRDGRLFGSPVMMLEMSNMSAEGTDMEECGCHFLS